MTEQDWWNNPAIGDVEKAERLLDEASAWRIIPSGEPQCCCECSPPEFGGNLPEQECPIHGENS